MVCQGEKNLHQKHHDQHKPPMECWCNGATNLGEMGWVQQLLALVEEKVENALDRKLKLITDLLFAYKSSSLPHQAESSVSSSLQLCFKGVLPETIHTKNNIEDEGASLELELCNDTGEKAEEISPELENLKVKILPLDGDFKVEDRYDWTQEEFETHVAIPRDDKPPILKSNSEISLKNGFARIHGICFTDNSSHMRNGKFRLGAQLVKGLSSIVRPAVSKAFEVKEYRLKADRKHPTPMPDDELWRLVNIRKSGIVHQRAVKNGVFTVNDFLEFYHTDAVKLQDILQLFGKKWDDTVKNAKACKKSQLESVYKLRQAAHEKEEFKKVHTSTNQTPVHAGPAFPCPTKQPAAAPLSISDYDLDGIETCSDIMDFSPSQLCCTSTTNTWHLNTAETAQGNFEKRPACLPISAYEVNNTSLASDNLVQHAEDSSLYLQFGPALNFTPANQGAISIDVLQWLDSTDDVCSFSENALADKELDFAKCLNNSSDQRLFNDSSANNPGTRKLIAACYMTKSATIFMISAQQAPEFVY